jgi:site-specific recombinase XerD
MTAARTLAVSGDSYRAAIHAESDAELLRLWLHDRPATTRRAYEQDAARFLAHVGKPLPTVTLGDLQGYADTLAGLAPATRGRRLSAVKSLLTFGTRLGYLRANVGAMVKAPPLKNRLAERILPESDVHRLIALEPDKRNRAMLRLLYAGGLRRAELVRLRWRDLQPREDAGQVNVYGKGGKTRTVLLPASVWRELVGRRGQAGVDDPVFVSRKGGPLDPSQVLRIVKAAAKRAGVDGDVSPHWLRHGHASHALDRGAPVHLVAATLGHASIATTGRYAHARPSDSSSRYLAV